MTKRVPDTLTIEGLHEAYDAGLTPAEVIATIRERSAGLAAKHIWITSPDDMPLDSYIAALPERDYERYPLWGIPFAVKDNIDVAGVPTTAACPAYAYTPEKSATVVAKLMAAGAIPVGKTNLDQFATGLVGTRSPYGEVENAYVPERISGGSSSGSAVSVATGRAAFALGTDTAGSGRVPAMLQALVGYKPPLGAWSTRGVVPACASLDCVTVFAHDLEEAKAVDRIARGYDADCCWSRHIEHQADALPERILIADEAELTFFGVAPDDARAKWRASVARMKKLGVPAEIISIKDFMDAAKLLYDGAFVAERWADLGDFVRSHGDEVFPVTKGILETGGKSEYTAARLFLDMHKLQEYRHRAAAVLQGAVLVMPTAGGTFTRDMVRDDPVATNSQMGLYTNHCNLLDLAAIAVPEDSQDRENPFGITIFALHEAEHLICGTAAAFLASAGR